MKRSKMVIGISSALLALAGVAATKIHKFQSAPVFYYTDPVIKGTCIRGGGLRICSAAGPGILCHTIYVSAANNKTRTLYTNGFVSASNRGCTRPAHENGE